MIFDKEWLEALIELEKKSQVLSKNATWPKEFVDMVMQAIQISLKNSSPFYEPDYFGKFKSLWGAVTQSVYEDTCEPKINITETDKEFLIKAAIPGIKDKSDISVNVIGNTVNISGRMYNADQGDILSFNKIIPLPAEVDSQKASAKYSDGILTLHLPKNTKAHTKEIEITFL